MHDWFDVYKIATFQVRLILCKISYDSHKNGEYASYTCRAKVASMSAEFNGDFIFSNSCD